MSADRKPEEAGVFYKRPDEFRAIQFDPNNLPALFRFCGGEVKVTVTAASGATAFMLGGRAGRDTARPGDWIVKGPGLYSCSHPDDTYDWIVLSAEEFAAKFQRARGEVSR